MVESVDRRWIMVLAQGSRTHDDEIDALLTCRQSAAAILFALFLKGRAGRPRGIVANDTSHFLLTGRLLFFSQAAFEKGWRNFD